MGTLETREIRSNLRKKGFEESLSGDHVYLHYYVQGKKSSIFTKISHGRREVGDSLIGPMAKQLRLSKNDFVEFAKCRITQEQYNEIVKDYI